MVITIPLYIFLFAYLFFLTIFVAFSIMNIYHIVMTASFTLASFIITVVLLAITVLTLFFTWQFCITVNWSSALTIFDSAWLQNIFIF
ncbi:MAG TPA: hypothetical protein VJB37_00765 [Patescibacteria group bacterium]|nr:hypothetical protein [Patescibacteria group bacterium]